MKRLERPEKTSIPDLPIRATESPDTATERRSVREAIGWSSPF
jgi:hypothetical protein